MSTKSDWKEIIQEAERQGWRVLEVKKGVKLVPPDKAMAMVVIHRTPSDNRALKNTIAQMKRSGFQWPPAKGDE